MRYRIEIAPDVRDWLSALRVGSPPAARLVGEAVTALFTEGAGLGQPLVVSVEWILRVQDPTEALDHAYQKQLELLQKVRRGIADVATVRMRLETQLEQLQQLFRTLGERGSKAGGLGRGDLAQESTRRQSEVRESIAEATAEYTDLQRQEEKLGILCSRLQMTVDQFRTRKEIAKAKYTAGQVGAEINRVFIDLGMNDSPGPDIGPASDAALAESRAAVEEMLLAAHDLEQAAREEPLLTGKLGAPPPPLLDEVRELRTGAPSGVEVRILFALLRSGSAVLLAAEQREGRRRGEPEGEGGWSLWYDQVLPNARQLLATRRLQGAYATYSKRSFLREFFPGRAKEVQAGAARLVAGNRVRTLARLRRQAGLSELELAERMQVTAERVSEIEQAGHGTVEVSVLAAYLEALGGRIEVVADLGGERIVLG